MQRLSFSIKNSVINLPLYGIHSVKELFQRSLSCLPLQWTFPTFLSIFFFNDLKTKKDQQKKMSESNLKSIPPTVDDTVFIFKCIVNFIHDLSEIYGSEQKSLQLYDVLMDKTGIVHQEPIKKHIQIFHEFLQTNEDAILEKDVSKFEKWDIVYSEKVYID